MPEPELEEIQRLRESIQQPTRATNGEQPQTAFRKAPMVLAKGHHDENTRSLC